MTKRQLCTKCERPLSACLCHTIRHIANRVELVVLQHPSEKKHAKGTAKLLKLSLERCQLWIGEDFSDHDELNELLADPQRQVYLLYPGDEAISPEQVREERGDNIITVILLDGTWKKAYKMLCLNPHIAALPKIAITPVVGTNYRIRKAPREDSLSSVEAGAEILSVLEQDREKFQPLLKAFDYLVNYQLSRMPEQARKNHPAS